MQRRAITGAQLRPDASQHVGMLNAEKCVCYLRGIGVEIDDQTAEAWLDTQATYRFLKSERAPWRTVEEWTCQCGAMRGFRETGRGRKRLPHQDRPADQRKPNPRCQTCGTGWVAMHTVFVVRRDGTVIDRRRGVEAVIPLRLDEWAGGL